MKKVQMSIALFAAPAVLLPLQGLWRRLLGTTAPDRAAAGRQQPRLREGALCPPAGHTNFSAISRPNTIRAGAAKPLRIVRILEAGQTPCHVGRMLISGRMADVCAELDRLAAREAALH